MWLHLNCNVKYLALSPEAFASNAKRETGGCVQWHISFPSIIYWTLFNEGWGQFDTVDTIRWASKLDPSRLWDAASGWVDPADPSSSPSTSNHGNATGYVGLHPLQ